MLGVKFLIFVGFVMFYFSAIFADTNLGLMDIERALQIQDDLMVQDQNRLRYDQSIRDQLFEKKQFQDQSASDLSVQISEISPNIEADLPSFMITDIQFDGVKSLNRYHIRRLKASYLNRELSLNHINQLVNQLTNLYIRKGYITTRAYIPTQNLNSGVLTLMVQEGMIEDVRFYGLSSVQSWNLFPRLKGKVLNIRSIEQGLDQLNRLQSNSARIQLLPSKVKLGNSIVVIQNQVRLRGSSSIRYDTLSQSRLAILPNSLDLSYDNLLGLNDQWLLNYSQKFKDQEQYNNSYSLRLSFPFRYSMLVSSYSQFDYLIIINGLTRQFNATGKTKVVALSLDHIIFRNTIGKIKLSTGLTTKETVSFIEDMRSDIGSHKLVILNVSSDYTLYLPWLGSLKSGITYYRGISRFNATLNNPLALAIEPKPQFKKISAHVNWRKRIKWLGVPIQFQLAWQCQYSNFTLYSSERIGIGGFSTVRGYRTLLQGDYGIQTSTTITYPLFKHLSFFHALDGGTIYQKGGRDRNGVWGEGSMIGISTGLQFEYRLFSTTVTLSKGIRASHYVEKPSYVLYFSLIKRFI